MCRKTIREIYKETLDEIKKDKSKIKAKVLKEKLEEEIDGDRDVLVDYKMKCLEMEKNEAIEEIGKYTSTILAFVTSLLTIILDNDKVFVLGMSVVYWLGILDIFLIVVITAIVIVKLNSSYKYRAVAIVLEELEKEMEKKDISEE